MVATRKTPLVPPPTSRSNSSQATPRTAKSKAQAVSNVKGDPAGDHSRTGPSTRNSGKGNSNDVVTSKSKSSKDREKSPKFGTSFGDFLMALLVASFAIYAIRVCPGDMNHSSAVCHGIFKYRQLVLEPYVVPAFHRTLAHPSIAPHVERVKPHVDTAVRLGRPIVRRMRVEWNKRIVPQWKKRVVPQWRKHIVPQLVQVDRMVEPYRSRAMREYTRYSSRITPHLRTVKNNVLHWQRQAQPYIVLAATKTYRGYQAAKPYAKPIWNHFKVGVRKLLLFAREQRVLFVDPHVARIWEKVKELSRGKPKGSGTVKEEPAPSRAAVPLTMVDSETIRDEATPPPATTSSVIPTKAGTASSVATESPIELSMTTSSTESKGALTSAVSTEESTSVPGAPPSSSEATPSLDVTDPFSITNEPTPTPIETVDEADEVDIDLDEFTRELGFDEPGTMETTETIDHPPEPPEVTESEEEKAERERQEEIKTATKRADIENRHTQWEMKLKELVRTKKKSLRKALVAIRKLAAVELKENKEIRAEVDGVAAEAEKYLKGAEAYLKSLRRESKSDAVKDSLWHNLLGKVDAKFRERLTAMDQVVNDWYGNVLAKEVGEVNRASGEVEDLISAAQDNIGMDYAWLPGVTYDDWQRFHDLARTGNNFTELAKSIQNGTHPSPPINPVLDILEELEAEVETIVDGFEARLGQLKLEGKHTLTEQANNVPVPTSTSEPDFSILPVPKDEVSREGATGDIPPVVIGRSHGEIEDAFNRAGAGAIPSQSVEAEPENIMENVAQEGSVEAGHVAPGLPVNHVEV